MDILQRALIVILGAIVLTSAAWSQPVKKESFEEAKAEILGHIDQRLQDMQQHKACIQASTDHAGLRACHEKMREKHKAQRAEMRGKRRARLDGRIDRLKERRERLDERTGPGTPDTGETPAETE